MRSTEAHLPEDSLSNPDEVIGRALHRLEAHCGETHREEEVVDTRIATPLREYLGPEGRKLQVAGWQPKERCGKTIWQSSKNGFLVLPGDGSGSARTQEQRPGEGGE